MKKQLMLVLCWVVTSCFAFAQNITSIEYFVDTDKGFGKGKPVVVVTPLPDIKDIPFSVDVTSYSEGLHKLFIRSRDVNGNWSVTNSSLFYKASFITEPNITAIEYFIDTDPGFGKATAVLSFTAAKDVPAATFGLNVAAFGEGLHRLFVRSRDANGNWGVTNSSVFYKANFTTEPNITAIEYFIDTDPGFGKGNSVSSFTANKDVSAIFNPNVASLSEGLHRLFVRSRDVNGKWGITNTSLFYKTNITSEPNIVRTEYFIDTDPGFGKATPLSVTASANVANAAFSLDISSRSMGKHRFFVRSLDANGKWSITNTDTFYKTTVLPVVLTGFDVMFNNNSIKTYWQTKKEINTSHFIVQRSTNGFSFSNISKVEASGNAAISANYEYTDKSLPALNKLYYRLQIVDKDGTFTYSDIKTVYLKIQDNDLNIYPNPVKDILNIQFTSYSNQKVEINIIDIEGKIVKHIFYDCNIGQNNFVLNINKLTAGSYILSISGNDTKQKMFIKQ